MHYIKPKERKAAGNKLLKGTVLAGKLAMRAALYISIS
jgi:hypothetical protein